MPDNTIDGEDKGDSKSPQLGEQSEQVKSLTEVMASLELPWPKDVFGVVPKEDWAKINEWAKKELGYPVDRISGDLMRHGWKCYERLLRERVTDLVSYGVVVTTDPSNPQKAAQEANKARINELKQLEPPEQCEEYAKLMGSEQCNICGFNALEFRRHIQERIKALTADKEQADENN